MHNAKVPVFNNGDRVRWIGALSDDYKNAVGTIVEVIPRDHDPHLTLYKIEFESRGTHTLLGRNIELVESR